MPDLSDTQVIVYSRWERSPEVIEAHVTYPLSTALLGTPRVKAVRGYSDFGFSYIYVLFEEGTDIYWARSRVSELIGKVDSSLPAGVKTEIGPDATGVGWIFQYALVDQSGGHSLADLRSLQDWTLRYALQSVPGVAEVATVGGYEKQFQVTVDPVRMHTHGVSLNAVADAVRRSNAETGGRVIEFAGTEYIVRGRGSLQTAEDLGRAVVAAEHDEEMGASKGSPLLLRDVAHIEVVPRMRRGVSDLDGIGEAVGGIVVMRHNGNAAETIRQTRAKLANLQASLPPGVKIVTVYDRSELIRQSIQGLRRELITGIVIVALVTFFFLFHVPSSAVPILTIPVTVMVSFLPIYFFGLNLNIVSLAAIALSIGVLVDGAIVEVENTYRKVAHWLVEGRIGDAYSVRLRAMQEVGPTVFYSLLLIAAAFLPVFALMDQEGRLFRPLAAVKTVVMVVAAIATITFSPALRMLFTRIEPYNFKPPWLSWILSKLTVGTYQIESRQPVVRALVRVYEPVARLALQYPKSIVAVAILLVAVTIPVYFSLGNELMPPLHEGTILYMPTTLPGISASQALAVIQKQDEILMSFPEVEHVFGKAGRAETATDSAPLSMFETTVALKPRAQWRPVARWYSSWSPQWLSDLVFRPITDDRISYDELIAEMDSKLRLPGIVNSWTMPIRGRTDMLTTGVRTPLAVKVLGPRLSDVQESAIRLEQLLRSVPNTRSVFAERVSDGYFLDIDVNRDRLAEYGLSVADALEVVNTAIGGEQVTTVLDGRARYGVSLRYPRERRESLEELGAIVINAPGGRQVPMSQIAQIRQVSGANMIRSENGMLAAYVYVDPATSDIEAYVERANALVLDKLSLPPGCTLLWSGQFESAIRVRDRLKIIIPVTLFLIVLLLYLNTTSWMKIMIILMTVPFSLVGAVWLMYALGYHLSVSAWVGMIGLMGLDAETGIFMLLFLDLSYAKAQMSGPLTTREQLQEAIIDGAVRRVRPKLMTVVAAILGLMPIMWSIGAEAVMTKRIVAPMIGGLVTSFLLELLVCPAIYLLWKWASEVGPASAALYGVKTPSGNMPQVLQNRTMPAD